MATLRDEKNDERAPNKGFTFHIGKTYLGFITIADDKLPPETVAELTDPETMKGVISNAELRPYKAKEAQDTTDVMDVIAGLGKQTPEVSEAEAEAKSA